ncbi:MAG: hypothetical protein U1F30_10980 [Steroidobacteraceae bacterium]
MNYDEIARSAMNLDYREKLRLALTLIQVACKEEEAQNPASRSSVGRAGVPAPELVQFVADRLRKLKPSRKAAVLNSIGAMFQFQGGVSDADKEAFISALIEGRHIILETNDRVRYPETGDA